MKTFSFALRILCLPLVCAGTLAGQSPETVPHEPLLPRAPDGSWTITYQYKQKNVVPSANGSPAPQPDRVATVRVEKKGTVYHVIITKTSGRQSENWCVSDMQIIKSEGGKAFMRITPENPMFMDFSKTDFDELSWIGMDNFKGVKDGAANAKVFIFDVKNVDRRPTAQEAASSGNTAMMLEKTRAAGGKDNKEGSTKGAVEQLRAAQFGDTVSHALFDVITQLPIDYDDGFVDRTYTFSSAPPPNAPLDIIQLLQAIRERQRRTFVRASSP